MADTRMGAADVVKDVMRQKGFTNAVLGKRIGVANTAVWERLNKDNGNKNMKVNTTVQMLAAMDYKLIAVPADKKMEPGWYELK